MLDRNSNLLKMLKMIYDFRFKMNYDCFICIDGSEGKGKSRGLFLNIAEAWYKQVLNQPFIPEYAINTDVAGFITALKQAKKGDFIGLDEAGDTMDSSDYANRFNRLLYQVYTVVREKQIFTVICLPNFFDLNPRFRRRRVHYLFHAKKRVNNKCGICGNLFIGDICEKCGRTLLNDTKNGRKGFLVWELYTRERIDKLIEMNQYSLIKKVDVGLEPFISGHVFEYKGELLEKYNMMKAEKLKDIFDKLDNESKAFVDMKGGKKICKHYWRINRKENCWKCNVCGKIIYDNPYIDIDELGGDDIGGVEEDKIEA
jgi:hypothetical protein